MRPIAVHARLSCGACNAVVCVTYEPGTVVGREPGVLAWAEAHYTPRLETVIEMETT